MVFLGVKYLRIPENVIFGIWYSHEYQIVRTPNSRSIGTGIVADKVRCPSLAPAPLQLIARVGLLWREHSVMASLALVIIRVLLLAPAPPGVRAFLSDACALSRLRYLMCINDCALMSRFE